jgi:hypothetical protein
MAVLRQAPDAPQERGQVLAIHVFHRQEGQSIGVADVVHPADVLVCDLPRKPHFVVELPEPDGVAFESGREELERHRLTER